jgi:hypothetical protein
VLTIRSLKSTWDDDVDAFVRCDFVEVEDGVRCVVNMKAVLTDIANLTFDGVTRTSVMRARGPVRLMRAERGLFDDDPVIPPAGAPGVSPTPLADLRRVPPGH